SWSRAHSDARRCPPPSRTPAASVKLASRPKRKTALEATGITLAPNPLAQVVLVVTGWICTPIQPRPACGALSLAFAVDAAGSIDWPEPPGPRRSAAAAKLAPVARRTRRRVERARSSLSRGIVSPLD